MFTDEKTLEDWIEANITEVVGHHSVVAIGRQMTLPGGRRIDLLALTPSEFMPTYTVVEVKRDQAGSSAISQLLGYMGILDECLRSASEVAPSAFVEGIIAAPDLSTDAARAINALDQVRYVRLDVDIAAATWGHIRCLDTPEDALVRLGSELLDRNLRAIEDETRAGRKLMADAMAGRLETRESDDATNGARP